MRLLVLVYILHSSSEWKVQAAAVWEQPMIIESVGVSVSLSKREELGRGLSSLLGPTRVEAGCVDCRLYQDVTDPNKFRLETLWRTEDDLERHVRSEGYKKLLFLMELGAEPPSIEFHEVSQTRGLEFIEEVRQT